MRLSRCRAVEPEPELGFERKKLTSIKPPNHRTSTKPTMLMRLLPCPILLSLLLADGCLTSSVIAADTVDNVPAKTGTSGELGADSSASKPADLPPNRFRPIDMFDLETATEPRISPDGTKVVFVRHFSVIMTERKTST